VPCPPELTSLIPQHLETYGTAPDGRLFRGTRNNGRIGSAVYGRTWASARAAVFTPEVLTSPLAKRPYDPPARRSLNMAQSRRGGDESRRVGRTQRGSPHARLPKLIDGGEHSARTHVEGALRG
jgi:hypothetical protein